MTSNGVNQIVRQTASLISLPARSRRVGIAWTRGMYLAELLLDELLDGLPVGRDAGRLLGLVGGSRSGRSRCPACHATSSCRSLLRKGRAPRPASVILEQPVSELNVHLGGAGQPVEEGRGVGGIDLQPDPLELGIIQADQVPLGSLVQGLLEDRRVLVDRMGADVELDVDAVLCCALRMSWFRRANAWSSRASPQREDGDLLHGEGGQDARHELRHVKGLGLWHAAPPESFLLRSVFTTEPFYRHERSPSIVKAETDGDSSRDLPRQVTGAGSGATGKSTRP